MVIQHNTTPLVILALIVLLAACFAGAIFANSDLINTPRINQRSTEVHFPLSLTATAQALRLPYAMQDQELRRMKLTEIPYQQTLDSYTLSATRQAHDAREEMKREEMETFAEGASLVLLPFLLVLASVTGLKIASDWRKQAEIQRIEAGGQVIELGEGREPAAPRRPSLPLRPTYRPGGREAVARNMARHALPERGNGHDRKDAPWAG